MTGLLENIHLALPEIIMLVTACVALLGDLFIRRWIPSIAFICSCIGLAAAALVSFLFLGQFHLTILNGTFDEVIYLCRGILEFSLFQRLP